MKDRNILGLIKGIQNFEQALKSEYEALIDPCWKILDPSKYPLYEKLKAIAYETNNDFFDFSKSISSNLFESES